MSSIGDRDAVEQDFGEPDDQQPDDQHQDDQKPNSQELEFKAENQPCCDSQEQHGKEHHVQNRASQQPDAEQPDAQQLNTRWRDAQAPQRAPSDLQTQHNVKSYTQERHAPKLGGPERNLPPWDSHSLSPRPFGLDRDTPEDLTQEPDTREREPLCKQFAQMQLDQARHPEERLAADRESVDREGIRIRRLPGDRQPRAQRFPYQPAQEPGVVQTDRRQGCDPQLRQRQKVERDIQFQEAAIGLSRAMGLDRQIQQYEQQLQQRKELNELQRRHVPQQDVLQEDVQQRGVHQRNVQQRERIVKQREIAVEKWQMKVHQRERIVERRESTVELRERMVEQREKALQDQEVMRLRKEQEESSKSESSKTQGPE